MRLYSRRTCFDRVDAEAAAKTMPAQLISGEIRTLADIDDAFQVSAREGVKFVAVYPDPMFQMSTGASLIWRSGLR